MLMNDKAAIVIHGAPSDEGIIRKFFWIDFTVMVLKQFFFWGMNGLVDDEAMRALTIMLANEAYASLKQRVLHVWHGKQCPAF